MIDPVMICIYCGELMESLTEKQMKVFGHPNCCDLKMLVVERNKLFQIVKGLEVLKAKMEAEIVKGIA